MFEQTIAKKYIVFMHLHVCMWSVCVCTLGAYAAHKRELACLETLICILNLIRMLCRCLTDGLFVFDTILFHFFFIFHYVSLCVLPLGFAVFPTFSVFFCNLNFLCTKFSSQMCLIVKSAWRQWSALFFESSAVLSNQFLLCSNNYAH